MCVEVVGKGSARESWCGKKEQHKERNTETQGPSS